MRAAVARFQLAMPENLWVIVNNEKFKLARCEEFVRIIVDATYPTKMNKFYFLLFVHVIFFLTVTSSTREDYLLSRPIYTGEVQANHTL